MPTSIWLFLSFVAGLVAGAPFVTWTLKLPVAIADFLFNSSEVPWTWNPDVEADQPFAIRILAVFVVVALFAIALGEASFVTLAFNIEEALASELYVHVAVAFLLGLLVRLNWNALDKVRWRIVWALKGADPVPWQTQLASLLLLCLIVVAFARPDVVERMSFLKAGEVEVHIAEGSASAIRDAPVNFDDFSHKEILKDWSDFSMLSLPKEEKNSNQRRQLYRDLYFSTIKLEDSQKLFDIQFNIIFKFAKCFQDVGLVDVIRNDNGFRIFVKEYANLIKRGTQRPQPNLNDQFDEIVNLNNQERRFLHDFQISWTEYARAKTGKEASIDGCSNATDQVADPEAFKKALIDGKEHGDTSTEPQGTIWDPYIVATVADLIAFLDDQKARADFLNEVTDSMLKSAEVCEPDIQCTGLTPGIINLLYANVDAQVKSHATWPLKPQTDYLDKALDGLEVIIHRVGRPSKDCGRGTHQPKCEIRTYYLQSKFIELSLGLELYYHHALSGEILTEIDRARWGLWINDMQRILDVLLGIHPGKLSPFVDDEAVAWREAAPLIQDMDSGALIADGESGAALGIVLLAKQSGTPSAEDCLEARALSAHLIHHQYPAMVGRPNTSLDVSAAKTYKGIIDQFDNRIRAECPRR